MALETIDLATALRLLELPRSLGAHPESGAEIKALNGKFGPYITCAGESRSLPADVSPLDVTLEQALALLAQPKLRGKRSFGAAALKTLGPSPVTGKPVEVRSGRYGPYVADGVTNASLPKDADPATVTIEQALELLAARAATAPRPARGGFQRGGAKRGGAKAARPAKAAATGDFDGGDGDGDEAGTSAPAAKKGAAKKAAAAPKAAKPKKPAKPKKG
jgi:DNA topoisomerase-1